MSYLPSYPSVYNTGAIVTLTADEPLYYHAGRCQTNNACNGTTVIRCCNASDCDPVALAPLPTAPSDCVCPSAPNSVCLDTLNTVRVFLIEPDCQISA